MALLKLPRASRATISSGKEFQVDAILRTNDLRPELIVNISKAISKFQKRKKVATSNTVPSQNKYILRTYPTFTMEYL